MSASKVLVRRGCSGLPPTNTLKPTADRMKCAGVGSSAAKYFGVPNWEGYKVTALREAVIIPQGVQW